MYGDNNNEQNDWEQNDNNDFYTQPREPEVNYEKWQPEPEKYNTYQEPQTVTVTEKKRRRWWIPVIIVLAAMVVIIAVGSILAMRGIRNWAKNTQNVSENSSIAVIESAEPETSPAVTSAPVESSAGNSTGSFYLTDVSDIVDEVMPAVVSITSRTLVNSGGYWDYFFGGNVSSGSSQEVPSGIGSGTIIGQNDTELLILTSYHVVEDSSSLYVTFVDDSAVDGYIKSASEENDIAIVAVPLSDLTDETVKAIRIASLCTDEPAVGDGAIVIGNALGYGQSVTTGIVSAKERTITVEGKTLNVLQTNAAINNGNSGGCMLNAAGQIIGISEAKVSTNASQAGVEGMCYAIPIYSNLDLIRDLMNQESEVPQKESGNGDGDQTAAQGAFLGIYGRDIDSELASSYNLVEGVYIIGVTSGGGAQKAGLQEGDIIVAVDGGSITTMSELQALLAGHEPGDVISVTVMHENGNKYEEKTVDVTLTGSL